MTEPPSECASVDRRPTDVTNTTGIGGTRDTIVIAPETTSVTATIGMCLPEDARPPVDRHPGDGTVIPGFPDSIPTVP